MIKNISRITSMRKLTCPHNISEWLFSFSGLSFPYLFSSHLAGASSMTSLSQLRDVRLSRVIKIYLETLLLERTIIQKIIEALDTKYLAALCNLVTRQTRQSSRLSLTSWKIITAMLPRNKSTTRQLPSNWWPVIRPNQSTPSLTPSTTWSNVQERPRHN